MLEMFIILVESYYFYCYHVNRTVITRKTENQALQVI